jgi:hypothetical protein
MKAIYSFLVVLATLLAAEVTYAGRWDVLYSRVPIDMIPSTATRAQVYQSGGQPCLDKNAGVMVHRYQPATSSAPAGYNLLVCRHSSDLKTPIFANQKTLTVEAVANVRRIFNKYLGAAWVNAEDFCSGGWSGDTERSCMAILSNETNCPDPGSIASSPQACLERIADRYLIIRNNI